MLFSRSSSIVSPSRPPSAGVILLNANVDTLDESTAVVVTASIRFIVLAGSLAFTPPPIMYLIVNVVFEGANRKI